MFRKADEREVITRASVGAVLKRQATQGVAPLSVFLFFGVLLSWMLFVWMKGDVPILAWILLACGILQIGAWIFVIVHMILTRSAVDRGEFTVTEEIFSELETRLKPRHHRSRDTGSYELIFYFKSGKTYTMGNVVDERTDNGSRQVWSGNHAKAGDVFYVVTFDRRPNTAVLIYHSALFRYQA